MDFELPGKDGVNLQGSLLYAQRPLCNLVIIHGLGEHRGRYKEMAAALSGGGVNVFTYDQRGHGATQGKRGVARLEELSRDAVRMVEYAKQENGLPTALFGHSMGGGVGLHTLFTLDPPVFCAIITSPWVRLCKPPPKLLLKSMGAVPLLFHGMNIKNGISASALCHDDAVVETYGKDPLNHAMVGLSLAADLGLNFDCLIKNAKNLTVPLLLLHGTQDPICSIEGSRAIKMAVGEKCRFIEYEGMYHELHNEPRVKEEVFALEGNFLLESLEKQ